MFSRIAGAHSAEQSGIIKKTELTGDARHLAICSGPGDRKEERT